MVRLTIGVLATLLAGSGAAAQTMKPIDWFSYRPPAPAGFDPPGQPADSRNGLDDLAEKIVVIGERQRRDFQETRPDQELAGPRALDAAQPVVPWIGTTCSYKTLCYDMSQPPLRAVFARLFSD
jgi:hypothetical protein